MLCFLVFLLSFMGGVVGSYQRVAFSNLGHEIPRYDWVQFNFRVWSLGFGALGCPVDNL